MGDICRKNVILQKKRLVIYLVIKIQLIQRAMCSVSYTPIEDLYQQEK